MRAGVSISARPEVVPFVGALTGDPFGSSTRAGRRVAANPLGFATIVRLP